MHTELQTRKTQVNRNGEPSFDIDLYYDLSVYSYLFVQGGRLVYLFG